MHIWMLHKRLISPDNRDPDTAALIQEEFFDIFWSDATNRMRAHGVNEMMINKNLKSVQQYSFMHCFHYDHCYSSELLENPKERLEELKNLVMTHILLLNPDDHQAQEDSADQAERIAWYIETQYQNIVHDLPDELFEKARIAWVDLPDFSDLKDASGKELETIENDPEDILSGNWVRNIANDGSFYYWNTETRESQWERPHD
jgi:cytochrome b pre-mRNA-processing protein 3